jgi:hypothetical protein
MFTPKICVKTIFRKFEPKMGGRTTKTDADNADRHTLPLLSSHLGDCSDKTNENKPLGFRAAKTIRQGNNNPGLTRTVK